MSSTTITVQIKSGQNKWEVTVDPESSVSAFKEEISKVSEIPSASQRLIYSGKILKDDQTLNFYKLQDGQAVHLVKSNKGTGSGNTAAAGNSDSNNASGSSANGNVTSSTPMGRGAPSNLSAGQSGGFNPLADLTSARYAGFTSLPSADMFGPDGGATNMPNQEDLLNMLDNPIFQSQMNEMLSNPQMVDFMIQSNPQLQAMGPQARQLFQSPFFRQMLTNPQMIRQSMQFARMMNPNGGETDAANSFPAPGDTGAERDTEHPSPASSSANPFAALLGGSGPLQQQPGGFDSQLLASLLGARSQQQQPLQDNRPPEERYQTQLRQLNDMGFFDFDRNIAALRRSGGSVQGALDSLLNGDV